MARSHGYSSGSWSYHNFYHSDGNGNVVALVNSGGTLQASYIYDPYGRYLIGTGTLLTSNVMRFSSKPWVSFLSSSTTSGLYYYGYRFYDPYLQRWLNRDPIEEFGGPNLYLFADNDAAGNTDVWGLKVDEAWCAQWFLQCVTDNLRWYKDCQGCIGPSVGKAVAACAVGCLPFLKGTPQAYAVCLAACAGADSVVFLVGSSWCVQAYQAGMKGCRDAYDFCDRRVRHGKEAKRNEL